MKKSIENKIRFNVALIYMIVALVCGGMILYVYKLRDNIDNQKREIEQYHQTLSLTNELVYLVNQAQTTANLYVSTKKNRYQRSFREHVQSIDSLIDSLAVLAIQPAQEDVLREISTLLNKKVAIVKRLNNQFNSFNPLDQINEKLRTYEPIVEEDSVVVTTVIQDTIIHTAPKKKFWKRLSEVFSPRKNTDTIVTYSTFKADTLTIDKTETKAIISEVSDYAEQARINYAQRIDAIEKQVNNLIASDHQISSQISDLLIKLYRETIDDTLEEIHKSEQYIRRNYNYSIIGGVISLVLILIFVILIINDVNKGYAARLALEKANIHILQIMDSRHKLLLSVSHDIKTPLNSILGYLELWCNKPTVKEQEVVSMQNSGKHILALLENLLEFSSLEQGTLQVNPTKFHIAELCHETVDMFAPLAAHKNIVFEHLIDFSDSLLLSADSLKIKQIIINILSNSVKYTVRGSIRFQATCDETNLYFQVDDTGAGIPKEKIDQIFKPFSRIEKNNSLAEGTGLGMFVVKGLIELLQGNITVRSEVGYGTCVKVSIPVEVIAEKIKNRSLSILAVDDDPTLLAVLSDMLARLGHSVVTCKDQIAFNQLQESISNYDAVITDMEMGSFSGVDILHSIRKINTDIQVFIMTARTDFNDKQANLLGFDGYLQKPFFMSSLARLFGRKERSEYDLKSLEDMFDGDHDAISRILQVFVNTTSDNVQQLREAIDQDNFTHTQAICHKMLPMFSQLGAIDAVTFLKKMDSLRGFDVSLYPEWKQDTMGLIEKAEKLTTHIQKTRLS